MIPVLQSAAEVLAVERTPVATLLQWRRFANIMPGLQVATDHTVTAIFLLNV
jgi:hypothetical protein